MSIDTPDSESSAYRHEGLIVAIFCLLAVVRVSIFLAAFPFFSSVDEGLHVDLVVKYSQGHFPHGVETLSSETGKYLSLYSSPEYLNKLPSAPKRFPAPAWKEPAQGDDGPPPPEFWLTHPNFESGQMPLYYMVAGLWMNFGELVGFEGIELLYWTRFLNALIAGTLVWLSYIIAKRTLRDAALRLSVPLLIAFIPQDAFYQLENDVLSPICFGLLFLCIIKLFGADALNTFWAILTGLAFSATYLVKTSNLPLLAVAGLAIILKVWQWGRVGKLRGMVLPVGLLGICALVPIAGWTAWFEHAFGDPTGSATKMKMLGWTEKSFLSWFQHPIFTLRGAWTFWDELIASFWRGEMQWYKQRISSPGADLFYCVSTTLLMIAALIGSGRSDRNRWLRWFSLACFAAAVCFYVLLSMMFDFGTCPYPSRAFPYFASGRLLSGLLIPIALLYVQGLNRCLSFTKRKWPVLLSVGLIVILITASEIAISYPVFRSEYNWFHL